MRPMDERERLQHRLEVIGFVRSHARMLAVVLHSNKVSADDIERGIRFELSGKLTSVFREDGGGRTLVCQVERS